MSKNICSLIAIFAIALPALSQKAKIGIFANTNYAIPSIENSTMELPDVIIDSQNTIEFDPLTVENKSIGHLGFDIGTNISFKLSKKVNFYTGLGFRLIRFDEESRLKAVFFNADGSSQESKLNKVEYSLKNIRLPASIQLQIQNKISLYGGAELSYLIQSIRKYEKLVQTISFDNSEPPYYIVPITDKNGEYLNHLVFGIIAGLEYSLSKKVGIVAEYNRSLGNIFNDNKTAYTSSYKAKNNLISFGLIYNLK